jgi:hypothetical protein
MAHALKPDDIRKQQREAMDKKREDGLKTLLSEPEKKEAAEVRTLVPVKSSSTALAVQTDNPTADYLNDYATGSIPGTLCRYNGKDGQYVKIDGEPLELGDTDTFVFLSDQVWTGWIKFDRSDDHKPPECIQGLLADGFRMPPRDSLGDTDKSLWPTGLSGFPEDPWKHQIVILLQHCTTGELLAFLATNPTSRNACHELMRHCERRKRIANDYPQVRLKSGGYERKEPPRVWVHKPTFAVVGHQPKSDVVKAAAGNIADDLNDSANL